MSYEKEIINNHAVYTLWCWDDDVTNRFGDSWVSANAGYFSRDCKSL